MLYKRTNPRDGCQTISGARLIPLMPRPTASKLPAEANPKPISMGRGLLRAYSNQPLAQCKGRSDPFTEISPDAPTTRRFGPLTSEDRARRVAELRTVLACPGVPSLAPCRGTEGAAVNCPTTRCSIPAAAPRTGRGESAPGGPNTTRSASPSPPSPTTLPPIPGFRRPICGCWRPSSTSPGLTPAAGPATTQSPLGSIATQGPSGGHYATWRTSGTSVGNRPGRIPPVA